jgi:cellulose synthase/poly-beta-1,6-N-acetylglucosamine synthase-like glycosyltransferase/putative flippase GtrA
MVAHVLAARPHLARYPIVGLLCTGFQLVLFSVLSRGMAPSTAANTLAFVLSTQLNFALSHRFTWAHRRGGISLPLRRLASRWLGYNGATALGVVVNAVVFYFADVLRELPGMTSAVIAVAASTLVVYSFSSRMIFAIVPEAAQALPAGASTVGGDTPPAQQRSARALQPRGKSVPRGLEAAPITALAYSARVTATPFQRRVVIGLAVVMVIVLAAALLGFNGPLLVVLGLVTALYFVDLLFCAYLVTDAMRRKNRATDTGTRQLESWPMYTVLCPMYRETAVLPQFVAAMTRLDYPAESLQVLLLLEEDDVGTIEFARRITLPANFEVAVVPNIAPKTKPKACNFGLRFARGEYVVIFDAEDVPEPDQLKKAATSFADLPSRVACLQAPLNFYNPRQNVLTRLFTAEYSLWFDLIMLGLQRLNGPIPLGGTSNHFRTEVLRSIGGWDVYNVTEDADVGIRLYKHGFRTAMLDSTTFEEANSSLPNWIRQRSRWIKGYLQTLLVHTRGGWDFRRTRDPHFFTFLLIIGGKAVVTFINPLMWAITISYVLFRASIGHDIESLYPAPVFYPAVFTLLLGNLLFVYTFLLGSARRGDYDLIKYGLLAPFYWLLMSVAACKALWQLVREPHYWEKTEHGLHLHSGPAYIAQRHENTKVLQ